MPTPTTGTETGTEMGVAAGAESGAPTPAKTGTKTGTQAGTQAGTEAAGVRTLAIDVGGSRLKAGVLDEHGKMVGGPARADTPRPAPPSAVLDALSHIVSGIGDYQRISIGFPGMIRHGRVLTAPNLDTAAWRAFPLAAELARRLGQPARMLNDATVQGLGVIAGTGLECVITLGTGMGFALFHDGLPAPQMEMGQHNAHKRMSYDQYVGNAGYVAAGAKRWNRRLRRVIAALDVLVDYDALLIGGGNAKHIAFDLPARVRAVPNEAGITGGVRLWDAKLDPIFVHADAEAR